LSIATPVGYEAPERILREAQEIAGKNKTEIKVSNDPFEAVKGADVVYTDVWTSMGQESEREKRLEDFKEYQVNKTLLDTTGKDTLIMHCLPAHRGEEISDVIDGKHSIVYDQAENRMHVEKAVLLKLMQ
jgi:ornithine carbamoyltransferase